MPVLCETLPIGSRSLLTQQVSGLQLLESQGHFALLVSWPDGLRWRAMEAAVGRRRSLAVGLLLASLAACTRTGTEPGGAAGSAAVAAAAAAVPASPLELASATAFDLTVSERGALLAWAAA